VLSGGPGPGIPIHNQCATGNFNGDGKTDIACYTGNAGNYHVWLSGPGLAHALRSIEFPTGVVVTYDYTWSDNSAQRFLPEVTPVLRSIKVDADGGAPPTILMFSFRSGYFHAPAREFRGFAQAEVTYPIADDGKRRILLLRFHQGAMSLPDNIDFDAPIAFMKGRPYRSETQNDNGGQYNIITTEYTQLLGGNTFVRSRWNVRVW
jgi:hypothetical protein